MTDPKIVFTTTDARAVEWPEDVKYEGKGFDKNGRAKQLAYEQACREAIEKGVKFKVLDLTPITLTPELNKPYDVPMGFEIKKDKTVLTWNDFGQPDSYKEYAELVPVQPKAILPKYEFSLHEIETALKVFRQFLKVNEEFISMDGEPSFASDCLIKIRRLEKIQPKEESQDELWQELIKIKAWIDIPSGSSNSMVLYLKSKFEIKRK